jgi:hypothetical protein
MQSLLTFFSAVHANIEESVRRDPHCCRHMSASFVWDAFARSCAKCGGRAGTRLATSRVADNVLQVRP